MRDKKKQQDQNRGPLANEAIRVAKIQVIDENGENIGIISRDDALTRARMAGLDLVMIAENGALGEAVAKIMDLGKELYNKKKKQNEAKKNQKVIQVKEIKMRPKIGEHDYQTKMNQGIGFLNKGQKLKMTITFQGREMANKRERGDEMFKKIEKTFEDCGILDKIIREKESFAGRMWTIVYSLKT